jgi:hypothetical protein
VIVGNDRVIPHRRVQHGDLASKEHQYAPSITADTPLWASAQADMILTDDYYADREPVVWQGHEVYVPDYAIGRLIESPAEIVAFIDPFLTNDTLTVSRALVTGYHFVDDTAGYIGNDLFRYDGVSVDDTLVGQEWTGAAMRAKHLNASPPFDMQSINGHATHTSEGTPDNAPIQAAEIVTATADFSRSLIFTVGCHSGLNDTGMLDLAQAFAQKQANYVGNTGYGWGGDGKVYSEKLMYNFARELLRDTTANMGKALQAAKRRYYQTESMNFSVYDEAVLMESIFYGLPMYRVVTGGTLGSDNPFPSAAITTTSPSAFGGLGTGGLELGLPASFGAFSETTTSQGVFLALNDNISFGAGEPVQPRFYASLPASASGPLHGALFLGGVYTDVAHFDPVVALPFNETITSTAEPAFAAVGWYPAVPFSVRPGAPISSTASTVIALLGQFDSATGTERVYDRLSFATYFSSSSDAQPPTLSLVDGVLDAGRAQGRLKVEADDPSGIQRIVVTYTDGQGVWRSQDLTHDTAAGKWTGAITATLQTQFMIQAVDGAGNVGIDDNKGQYRRFAPPVPFIAGRNLDRTYLPTIKKGG